MLQDTLKGDAGHCNATALVSDLRFKGGTE